jgi:autotransporter-associated beta strand protein
MSRTSQSLRSRFAIRTLSIRSRRALAAAAAGVTALLAVPEAAEAALVNRYSFATDASDSVGTAHGVLVNNAAVTGGQLVINPTTNTANPLVGQYVDLPNNTGRSSSFTIEGWATWNGGNDWQRFFDFGTSTAGERLPGQAGGHNGTSFYYVTPRTGNDAANQRLLNFGGEIAIAGQPPSQFVNARDTGGAAFAFPTGTEHYFALTLDDAANTMSLYIGRPGQAAELVAQNSNVTLDPATINMNNVWIGRSNFGADSFYRGSINEFRIWYNALSAQRIAANFAAGPDALPAGAQWVGTGPTDAWNDGTKWSTGVEPTGSEVAVIGNGGTANVNTPANTELTQISNGTLNINSGGDLTTAIGLSAGNSPASATLNVNAGGTLRPSAISVTGQGTGARAINLNGGTIANTSSITVAGNNLTTTVGPAGGTFDTQFGTTVAWAVPLTPAGAGSVLSKIGPGSLLLTGGGYAAPVSVRGGLLSVAGDVGGAGPSQIGDIAANGGDSATLRVTAPATVSGPISIGTAAGQGNFALRSTAAGAVNVTGPITLNQGAALGNTGTGPTDTTNVMTLSGGIANANPGAVDLVFDNSGLVNVQGVGISEASTGTLSLVKNGTGTLNLLAPNGYAGTTTINNGVVYFKSPGAIPGSGRTVTVNSNPDPAANSFGVAAAGDGFTPGTLATTFFPRINTASNGAAALTASTNENFNFSDTGPGALNLPTLSLGAHGGDVTYSGTITPAGGVYRLGGGSGNLILPNADALSGANSLVVSGAGGRVTLGGANSYTGGTTVNFFGTLSISDTNQLGSGPLILNNGTLRVTGTNPLTMASPISIDIGGATFRIDNPGLRLTSGITSLSNEPAPVVKTGPGMLTFSGGTVGSPVSYDLGNRRLLIQEGGVTVTDAGTVNVGQWLSVGQELNQRGTLIVEKDAQVNVGGDLNVSDVGNSRGNMFIRDNAVVSANVVFVGKNNTSQGALLQTGGQLIDRAGGAESRIGNAAGAVGAYTMTGGTFTASNNLQPGATGRGALTQTGGTVTVGEWYASGRFAGGYGVHSVLGNGTSGGTFNQTGSVNPGVRLIIGEGGTGILNVADGGTVNSATGISLGHAGTGTGIVNLMTGGTINTPMIFKNAAASRGVVNFHGGTLKPTAPATGFMGGLTAAHSWSDGGAIIDTNGHDITISQAITAPPGQGVSNIVVATPGAGYIAHPVVEITGGGGLGASAIPVLNAAGEVTGVRITNPGTNYTSAPTVRILGGGAATEATLGSVTLSNNTGGGLTKTGAGVLTLSGANTYSGLTTIAAGTLRLPSVASTTGLTHRYSFNTEGDTQATDSVTVNPAHGTLVRGASVSGGKLRLDNPGNLNLVDTGQYVDLPNNTARTSSFTIEGWTNFGGGNSWQRIFDFGSNSSTTNANGEIHPDDTLTFGYNGTRYIFLTPDNDTGSAGNDDLIGEMSPPLLRATANQFPADDTEHHFALSRDAATSTMRMYFDGQLVSTVNNASLDPTTIEMVNMWLGRSNFSADAFYNGDINEFRIFDRALSDAALLANFQAGPDGQINVTGQPPPAPVDYIPVTSTVNITAAGATFDLANQNSRIGALAGVTGSLVNLGSGALTMGGNNSDTDFAGVISGGGSVVKEGTGVQTLSGANTYTGSTTVNGGTLKVTGSIAPSSGVTVNTGGIFEAGATQTLSALAINPGGSAVITPGGNRVLKTGSLAITDTGKLDLTNNDLIVTNTPANIVRDLIRSAYGTGTWNGPGGILTSMPTPSAGKTAALGWAQGNDANLSPSLGGQLSGVSFGATDTIVKYTYQGDADLDGDVDGNDVAKWAVNFTGDLPAGSGTKTWTQGDWDGDRDVDGNDVAKWAVNFTGDLPPGSGLSVDVPAEITGEAAAALASLGFSVNVVPEPTILGAAVGVSALAMSRKRRRRAGP